MLSVLGAAQRRWLGNADSACADPSSTKTMVASLAKSGKLLLALRKQMATHLAR